LRCFNCYRHCSCRTQLTDSRRYFVCAVPPSIGLYPILDPEVAEKPEELVVYGGTGKAARNWECFHAIVRSLKALEGGRDRCWCNRGSQWDFPDARVCAEGVAVQFESGGNIGIIGTAFMSWTARD